MPNPKSRVASLLTPEKHTSGLSAYNQVQTTIPSLWGDEQVASEFAYQSFQRRYFNLPDQFALDCIKWPEGEAPTAYQLEILRSFPKLRRYSVRGPHGLGKTAIMAITILWYSLTRDGKDWKIATTASAWRQLKNFLWPEVRKWARLLKWDLIGREPFSETKELLTLGLHLKTGSAFAVATNDSNTIEGAHADYMMYIFDESKTIPTEMWDSAEGAMSGGKDKGREAFWLAVSTPGEPSGRFYELHQKKIGYQDWSVRAISRQEVIDAGRMDEQWAENRKRQWGANSFRYINRVEGNFAKSSEDSMIPRDWVEAAVERWHVWNEKTIDKGLAERFGVDVARYGNDLTVIAARYGPNVIGAIHQYTKQDTMETAGQVVNLLRANPGSIANFDTIGVGAGVYDRVREQYENRVESFIASGATDFTDKSGEITFVDIRSASWWYMRELLDPDNDYEICLPPGEEGEDDEDVLIEELTAPGYKTLSNGRIKCESKDDVKRRIGRSTNYADAVIMAFWNGVIDEGMEYA